MRKYKAYTSVQKRESVRYGKPRYIEVPPDSFCRRIQFFLSLNLKNVQKTFGLTLKNV
jgi:hypothetical protein